jgi:hypothetical protein
LTKIFAPHFSANAVGSFHFDGPTIGPIPSGSRVRYGRLTGVLAIRP